MGDCVGKPNSRERRNSVVPLTEADDMDLPETEVVHQTWCTSTSSYTKTDSGTDGQTLDTTCRESQPRPYNRSDRYLVVSQTEMEAAESTSTFDAVQRIQPQQAGEDEYATKTRRRSLSFSEFEFASLFNGLAETKLGSPLTATETSGIRSRGRSVSCDDSLSCDDEDTDLLSGFPDLKPKTRIFSPNNPNLVVCSQNLAIFVMESVRHNGLNADSPTVLYIDEFVRSLFKVLQIESSCCVIAYIYIKRLLSKGSGRLQITSDNWRSIVVGACLLASKFNDDLSTVNIDFARALQAYSLADINQLETTFILWLGWELRIPRTEYAEVYWALSVPTNPSLFAGPSTNAEKIKATEFNAGETLVKTKTRSKVVKKKRAQSLR